MEFRSGRQQILTRLSFDVHDNNSVGTTDTELGGLTSLKNPYVGNFPNIQMSVNFVVIRAHVNSVHDIERFGLGLKG